MAEEKSDEQVGDGAVNRKHSIFVLGADCTIRESVDLKRELLAHLERKAPLFIDGSAVERVDTTGVQLLVAFSLDCMERGVAFGWPGRSEALKRAIELLGVGPLLECPGQVDLPPVANASAN